MAESALYKPQLEELLTLTKAEQSLRLAEVNAYLESLSAQERVKWAFENLPGLMPCHPVLEFRLL